jgi:hypothetical protein
LSVSDCTSLTLYPDGQHTCPGNIAEKCLSTNICDCGTCDVGSDRNQACDTGFCCTGNNNIGPASGSSCVSKATITNSVWLCDPGTWFKCDEAGLNQVSEFNNRTFECVNKNGDYQWIETTQSSLVDWIAKIFVMLFLPL